MSESCIASIRFVEVIGPAQFRDVFGANAADLALDLALRDTDEVDELLARERSRRVIAVVDSFGRSFRWREGGRVQVLRLVPDGPVKDDIEGQFECGLGLSPVTERVASRRSWQKKVSELRARHPHANATGYDAREPRKIYVLDEDGLRELEAIPDSPTRWEKLRRLTGATNAAQLWEDLIQGRMRAPGRPRKKLVLAKSLALIQSAEPRKPKRVPSRQLHQARSAAEWLGIRGDLDPRVLSEADIQYLAGVVRTPPFGTKDDDGVLVRQSAAFLVARALEAQRPSNASRELLQLGKNSRSREERALWRSEAKLILAAPHAQRALGSS